MLGDMPAKPQSSSPPIHPAFCQGVSRNRPARFTRTDTNCHGIGCGNGKNRSVQLLEIWQEPHQTERHPSFGTAKSGKGVTCNVALSDSRDIFAESFSRAIVEVNDEAGFEAMAKSLSLSVVKIGTVGGESFTCNDISQSVQAISERYFNRFQEVIEQDI